MNKLGTKLGAVAMSAVMALSFAPSAAITSLAAGSDDVAKTAAVDPGQAIYGLYNPNSGEHLFTANATEAAGLQVAGWQEGDVKWYSPTSGTKVYRLYNPNVFAPDGTPLGDHHYTTDEKEVANLKKAGWSEDAEFFYAQTKPGEGSVPVYKLYNPNAYTQPKYSGAHHFTLDVTEKDNLLKAGWGEGDVAFYTLGKEKPVVEELTVSIDNTTPKVGDTLTATVVPADAAVKYAWYINESLYATSESITVPATAKAGDIIAVTVTDNKGNTASASVYVEADLALVSVEGADNGQNKVLIAYFSEPVGDLQPGDIQIRKVSDNNLTTVENVIMSSDKMTATVQLVGYASQNVVGLNANTEYRMIVTTKDGTAEKIFTIPGIWADAVVTSVDSSKNQIRLNGILFTLGDDIDVDFNEILGRTVTVEYDKNMEIQEFKLIDEAVLYGAYELTDTDSDGVKDSVKDRLTGDKYPLAENSVGSIYESSELNVDGEGLLLDDNKVAYAKITLNGNGSVRRITSITDFENVVYVAGVSGTDLLNVKGTATTLKDYNIFKDGLTITIDDIEAGDVVYIDTTAKQAEVYTDGSVSGKMTVYTNKIEVDGTRYDTKGDLVADGKDVAATNDNLKNYNGSNVELFFARTGDIAKIVVTDAIVNSTSKFVVLTDAAKLSVNGSTQTLEFKAGDGEEVKTYSIDLSKLESVIAANGSYAIKGKPAKVGVNTSTNNVTGVAIAANHYDAATLDGDIIPTDKDGALTYADYKLFTVSDVLKKGTLVGLTTKENGTITGLALAEGPDAAGTKGPADAALYSYDPNLFGGTSDMTFKAGYNSINNVLLPSTTPVLVYYPDSKEVKLYEYGDVDFTFTVNNNNDGVVRYDGNKAAVIAIDAKNAGIAAAEVNKKHAVIVGATFDQSSTKKLVDLTVAYETDAKVVYKELANDILETSLGLDVNGAGGIDMDDWKPGTYVEIEETKADGKLTKVTAVARTAALADYIGQDKSEFVINGTYKMITADDAGVPTTITTLSADGKTVKAISWSEYCDYDKTKVASVDVWTYAPGYVDVMVVTLAASAAPTPTTGLTVSIAAADGTPIAATTTDLKIVPDDAAITVEPAGFATVDSVVWYQAASPTATFVKIAGEEDLTLPAGKITAGKCYYAVVTDTEGEEHPSEKVNAAARVATTGTFTAVTGLAANVDFATATQVGTIALKDQFQKAIASSTADINGGSTVTSTSGATLTTTAIAGGFAFESTGEQVWFKAASDTSGVTAGAWEQDLTLTGATDGNLKIRVTVTRSTTATTVTGSVVAPTA